MTSWSMPHRTLQIVAFLLIAVAAGSFAMGLAGALQRGGHLPGQGMLSGVTGAAPVEAEDATPLADERIEGPPKVEEEKKAGNTEEAEAAPEDEAGNAPILGNVTPAPLELPPVGNAAEAQAPPPDEPPH
jgi:hypothetical protein